MTAHVRVSLTPSRLLFHARWLVHLPPMAGIWLSGLEVGYQLAFTLAVLASLVSTLQPEKVRRLVYFEGHWHLDLVDGRRLTAVPADPLVILSFLVVLNFRTLAGERFPVVVLSDNSHPEEFRALRVFLRFHPNVGGTSTVSLATGNSSG